MCSELFIVKFEQCNSGQGAISGGCTRVAPESSPNSELRSHHAFVRFHHFPSQYRGPSILLPAPSAFMSTPVISRKRARRSTAMISTTTASEDTPASRQNATLLLPTELIYTILAISIGDYLGDMMLRPSKILKWDAIMTFLHVSRAFRCCTIKLLYHLWGETFIRERTR
jgi:hypothetical protein